MHFLFASVFFPILCKSIHNATCTTPNITQYCLSGIQESSTRLNFLNGRYNFEYCADNNSLVFTDANGDSFGFVTIHNESIITLHMTNTNSPSLVGWCQINSTSNTFDCVQNWRINNNSLSAHSLNSEYFFIHHDSIYFGSNCTYALYTPSFCFKSLDFAPTVSITVPFVKNLSITFQFRGCHNGDPYFINQSFNKKNLLYKTYLYNSNKIINTGWVVGTYGKYNHIDPQAICIPWSYEEISLQYNQEFGVSNCVWFPLDYQKILDVYSVDFGSWPFIFAPGTFLAIYFSFYCCVCCWSRFYYCKCSGGNCCLCSEEGERAMRSWVLSYDLTDQENESNNESDELEEIELQETSNKTKRQQEHIEENNVDESSNKKKFYNWIFKIMYQILVKFALEIYDFYTDITLAIQWHNGYYAFQNGTNCLVKLTTYANAMFAFSTVGFVIGIIGRLYVIKHSFNTTNLSYQSLTNMKQGNVDWFTFGKLLLEDIPSMILCLEVKQQSILPPTTLWYLSFYTSCLNLTFTVMWFIRTETNNRCPMFRYVLDGNCIGECHFLLFLALFVSVFVFPWFGADENVFPEFGLGMQPDITIGFGVNDNDCQLFDLDSVNQWPSVNNIHDWNTSAKISFEVMDNQTFSIQCSQASYYMSNADALVCVLFNKHTNEIACDFWMYLQKCWTGQCNPYTSNLTVCFGAI
eukprot:322117_1